MKRWYLAGAYWFLVRFSWLLFTTFTRWKVQGRGNVPPRGPLIVVSNHMSWIDPSMISLGVPRRVTFLAKAELYRNPVAAFAIASYGAIRVVRGKPQREAMEELRRRLARDQVICLFPEGTRSRGELRRGRPGVAMLAMQTGAPILPVAITGSQRVRGLLGLFTRARVTVTIGEPFTLPSLEGPVGRAQLVSMADIIMGRIAAMLPASYQGPYAPKPRVSATLR